MLRHEKEMDNTNIVNKNLQSKKKNFFQMYKNMQWSNRTLELKIL